MIYGIGRNYASHAKELGNSVPEKEPMVFFKPYAAIVNSNGSVKLPSFSTNVHYEVELCFKFGEELEIAQICVGNDLTARDKQKEAQEKKSPWSVAKGFKQSCGLGNWVTAAGVDLTQLELKLTLNDAVVQHGFTKDMIFNCEAIRRYLLETFPVEPGDIVMTGTPEGVGAVKAGDKLVADLTIANSKTLLSRGQWKFS